ncbi:MAG: DUF1905 domain-containing protein [Roseibium sp.]
MQRLNKADFRKTPVLEDITFSAKAWKSKGQGAWTFVTMPTDIADQIRFLMSGQKAKGWGMIKVKARIGSSDWDTTIWPDKTSDSYLLPLKAAVRKSEKISEGDSVTVDLRLVLPGL